ncbi:Mannose-P-dolichol utilization defect 1 protein [Schistosoma japonicum]|nr:Mannose-P-dolichol utilization defect 1 protein [Schistosoma japonicum]KAH8862256.1 Mannose-P-dolichol utilization defect 1 protein [Schistosoma japonicum]KAH8862257.1 Mannose-P-dolichol utilization defect 1 protein [Schistosoma japonicum]KAH8862258.1 Mannose-P-dolichol utilization defect 1 protein [Schistosoma japonicum]KAH8862259.1 Mannose-P-dolichol utilization defect 1 protein [Schistosoma japonicum]
MSLEDLISPIVSKECLYKYIKQGDIFDELCFKATFSKLLGYGIVIGSSLVKIPQVLKVAKCKSAFGLSILSILLELISYTSLSVYSLVNKFPFSAYGEGIFLATQNFLLVVMAITWTYSPAKAVVFSCTYMACLALLLSPSLPLSVLVLFQTMNLPIMLSSKIAQIWTNYSNGSTGQLSAITLCLFAVGSTARIFTSIQETGDKLMIISCILASLCNYALLGQLLYYWNVPVLNSGQRSSTRKAKVN